jgi:flagellar basal-body rod protein FlgB
MHLFDLAARHRAWLAQGQAVVAENVSNVDTPGYRARRVADFSEVLTSAAGATLAATHRAHILPAASGSAATEIDSAQTSTYSGNTVNLDSELFKAGEIRSGYALNASVVKAFHRMLQQSVRG